MPRVEYFFDYVSPFAYLADTQLPALAQRTGAEIVHRPFFLGGVMQATKNSPPITVPNKGRYMFVEIQRWAKRYGVPANPNPHFPVNTLTAMRVAVAALGEPRFGDLHRALFRAVWVDGQNLADEAVLEATEEAILNSLFSAETMVGRDNHTRFALPNAETVAVMRQYGHSEAHLPGE